MSAILLHKVPALIGLGILLLAMLVAQIGRAR